MKVFEIEVFKKHDTALLFRLCNNEGELLQERPLDRASVESLVEDIEASSSQPAPDLAMVGRRLYEWLDGPSERWLEKLRQGNDRIAIHIAVETPLRTLPWELLNDSAGFLCTNPLRPFTPVRRVRSSRQPTERRNRPLRLLFMACSPEDVKPVLAYEKEESLIWEATQRQPIEMVVEESGSLAGLAERVDGNNEGHFDVFHLTGHAAVRDGVPVFIMESEIGLAEAVTANELAQTFGGRWPRLVFLSGCKTAQSPDSGAIPSFCEAMVMAGAPAVLGWARPVRDKQASVAAAELYRNLGIGKRIDESVVHARQQLFVSRLDNWHLLQLYADATPLSEIVTPLNTPDRNRVSYRKAHEVFWDAGAKTEVCPRELFVGRRRLIQRCLKALRSLPGESDQYEGILLYGMAGVGKSSLAARLCERLPQYTRIVWAGKVDLVAFLQALGSQIEDAEALKALKSELPLTTRLRKLFSGHLKTQSVLFIFDDFEDNLHRTEDGGRILDPETLDVLTSLLKAIREAGSNSRVLVTSRYQFPLPGPARLLAESLESMRGAELERKLEQLPKIASLLSKNSPLWQRANELSGGNPRLLKNINDVLPQTGQNQEEALSALVEQSADQFRQEASLPELIGQQSEEGRRTLALIATYELPIKRSALEAVANHTLVDRHLDHMVALGLVERGFDHLFQAERFLISAVVRPLLAPVLSDQDRNEACRLAMNHLYETKRTEGGRPDPTSLWEIHRLALLAQEKEIAAETCHIISSLLLTQAACSTVERICRHTLTLGKDYRVLHAMSVAELRLGKTKMAREHAEQALAQCPSPAPPVDKETTTRRIEIMHILACIWAQQGEIDSAINQWRQALDLANEIGDDHTKTSMLDQMAHYLAQQGNVEEALNLWDQSIKLNERIGNKYGLAATLHNMANTIDMSGDREKAMVLWTRSLKLKEQIGDIPGQIVTLGSMADVLADESEYERAGKVLDQVAKLAAAK